MSNQATTWTQKVPFKPLSELLQEDGYLSQEGFNDEPESSSTFVLNLDESLIRLCRLMMAMKDDCESIDLHIQAEVKEHQEICDGGKSPECDLFCEKMDALEALKTRLVNRMKAIRDLFWSSVKLEHPDATNGKNMSIRKGWVIVSLPDPSTEGFSFGSVILAALNGILHGQDQD